MFRRPRFRPVRRMNVPDLPPALRHAQQLMSQGRFEEAAPLFEQLAQGARERGLFQDARLYLTAGHCRLQADQIDAAMTNFRQGFQILALRANDFAFQRACQRAIRELNEKGYTKEAQDILERDLKNAVIPDWSTGSKINETLHSKRGMLPPTCPSCGGTLRSDEVEWIDEATAECSWCGSSVPATH